MHFPIGNTHSDSHFQLRFQFAFPHNSLGQGHNYYAHQLNAAQLLNKFEFNIHILFKPSTWYFGQCLMFSFCLASFNDGKNVFFLAGEMGLVAGGVFACIDSGNTPKCYWFHYLKRFVANFENRQNECFIERHLAFVCTGKRSESLRIAFTVQLKILRQLDLSNVVFNYVKYFQFKCTFGIN